MSLPGQKVSDELRERILGMHREGLSENEIGRRVRRSPSTVDYVIRGASYEWTDAERIVLRSLYGAKTLAEIAKILNRSQSSVGGQIKSLNLSKPPARDLTLRLSARINAALEGASARRGMKPEQLAVEIFEGLFLRGNVGVDKILSGRVVFGHCASPVKDASEGLSGAA